MGKGTEDYNRDTCFLRKSNKKFDENNKKDSSSWLFTKDSLCFKN